VSAAASEAWLFDVLGRRREWLPQAVLEDERLVLIQHTGVHHWAILIPLHMYLKTLVGLAP